MTSRIKVEIETPSLNEITTISSSGSQVVLKESLADDVDAAATAMLVLKHGACAFDIKPGAIPCQFSFLYSVVVMVVITSKKNFYLFTKLNLLQWCFLKFSFTYMFH